MKRSGSGGGRIVVGVAAGTHDSSCALLVDGRVEAAVAEERLTRVRHDPRLPVRAFRACLERVGASPADVAALGFFEQPAARRARQLAHPPLGVWAGQLPEPAARLDELRERLGYDGPVSLLHHHGCHAASAFLLGTLPEAAVLTLDGVGEWATGWLAYGRGSTIERLAEHRFPHSLGLFYAALTAFLGFEVAAGEGKTMGLAAYGRPVFQGTLGELVAVGEDGSLELDLSAFDYHLGGRMWSKRLPQLLGCRPREPGAPIEAVHCDVAASAQAVTESALLSVAAALHRATDAADLCFAGGVALNCAAVGRLRREGPFQRVVVPPAPGDSGAALGAAALAEVELTGRRPSPLESVSLGPGPSSGDARYALAAAGIAAERLPVDALLDEVVERLVAGEVVAWFEGRCELGPRALGARSILADPRPAEMRDKVNRLKGREPFRPLAPSILEEEAGRWFELDRPSPWMSTACKVRRPEKLAAVTHVDGTARPQTVGRSAPARFRRLLERFFERTGCPVLLNTSFNLAGEPIVATAGDALRTFAASSLDALVLDGHLVDGRSLGQRSPIPDRSDRRSVFARSLDRGLYTFV